MGCMDAGGEWHYWYEHNNNTRNILYQEPGKIIERKFVILSLVVAVFFLYKVTCGT
jgi:hypothetical protein